MITAIKAQFLSREIQPFLKLPTAFSTAEQHQTSGMDSKQGKDSATTRNALSTQYKQSDSQVTYQSPSIKIGSFWFKIWAQGTSFRVLMVPCRIVLPYIRKYEKNWGGRGKSIRNKKRCKDPVLPRDIKNMRIQNPQKTPGIYDSPKICQRLLKKGIIWSSNT